MNKEKFISYSFKYLKRIAGIVCSLIIFVIITGIFNHLYFEDTDYERILWHNFYKDRGKIDNLILGSSHVYCGFDPQLSDELNGKYNFNLATPYQKLNGSYYLLKEADKNNSISHVYLELYYMCGAQSDAGTDPIDMSLHWNWSNTDYMENSLNKLEYMLSSAGVEKYPDTFLPFVRFRSHLDNWDIIKEDMEKRQDESYLAYEYMEDDGVRGIRGQGYRYSPLEMKSSGLIFGRSRNLNDHTVGEKSEKYLRKIIEYCRKKDIPLTFFVIPMNEVQLISTNNYDNYVSYIEDIADDNDIEFYDFNLAKEKYLPIHSVEYFRDIGHLNDAGSAMFTEFFWEVISREPEQNEEYFYNSYAEKLREEAPSLYGVYYWNSTDSAGGAVRTFRIASNRDEGMEYRIIMTPDEGQQYTIQDFEENKEFTVSKDESGICTVVARMKDNADEVLTLEVKYKNKN